MNYPMALAMAEQGVFDCQFDSMVVSISVLPVLAHVALAQPASLLLFEVAV